MPAKCWEPRVTTLSSTISGGDGYQSQKVVIMEDVDKETVKFLHHHQDLGGPLGFIGETKGARLPPFTDGW